MRREEEFGIVFCKSFAPILILDGVTGEIICANSSFQEFLGYKKKDLQGKHISDFFPSFKKILIETILEKLKIQDFISENEELLLSDGSTIPVNFSLNLVDWNKSRIIIVTFKDRKEEVHLKEVLCETETRLKSKDYENKEYLKIIEANLKELTVARDELSSSERLKDEFLANMTHELRTPLNSILGMVEVLQEQLNEKLNDKHVKYLKIIEESGRHLLTLINEILDFSRIESGKFKISLTPVSVESVCKRSLEFVKEIYLKKNIQVSLSFDNQVSTIFTDERRLKQILSNLLSNAVKFTPERGKIGLEVSGNLEEKTILFTVWDTGIGIAAEDMKFLFKPFIQLDSSLSRKYSGTGLGLVLVEGLTELLGGTISFTSEVSKGSRFSVKLPWKKSSPHISQGR